MGKVGTSSANLNTVARLAGVSATTVSRVLNNSTIPTADTRKKVLAAVEQVGYRADPIFSEGFRRLRRGERGEPVKTRTIAHLVTEKVRIAAGQQDGYYSDVLSSVCAVAKQNKYFLMLSTFDVERPEIPDLVTSNRVDGLIIEATLPRDLAELLARRLPVVFLDRLWTDFPCDVVIRDNRRATLEILEYVWSLGHRNIALFSDTEWRHGEPYAQAAGDYFRNRNASIIHPHLYAPRDINPQTHERVIDEFVRDYLQASPRPTAIVATSNVYANPIVERLALAGLRVPQDVSVATISEVPLYRVEGMSFTSYSSPIGEMGRAAANLLIERVKDPTRGFRTLMIAGRMIERASCRPV